MGAGNHLARLDTLRAFAVCAVLVFHLKPAALPWGYIGVDMFFSLSGFLMTHLYLEARARGTEFPVGRFLARRFWRIFPPLAIVVLASLILSMLVMAPGHLLAAAWSGAAALFAVSNWVFFGEAGYFDNEAILKPLLHTWSLGVEEQFYVFFALALFATRWISLRIVLTLAMLVSFAAWAFVVLAELGSGLPTFHDEPFSALFFLPHYRAFQFAAGGLAAYAVARRLRALPMIGTLVMLVAAFTASDKQAAHLAAPLATLGMAALMIHAPFLDYLGKFTVIVYLAKISYQLYLVHWPIIVIWQYVTLGAFDWPEAFVCLAICIALGDVLFRLTNPLKSN